MAFKLNRNSPDRLVSDREELIDLLSLYPLKWLVRDGFIWCYTRDERGERDIDVDPELAHTLLDQGIIEHIEPRLCKQFHVFELSPEGWSDWFERRVP